MEFGIKNMSITFKDVDKSGFDFWEDVDPFDISREEQGACGGYTELRFRVQDLKLLDRAVSRFIGNEMAIFTQDIACFTDSQSYDTVARCASYLLL